MKNPTIVYHKDADGVCSAALVRELLSGTTQPNDGPGINITQNLLEIVKGFESVVFLDLPVDQLSIIDKLKAENIFILDHHPPERNLSNKNVLHVNPRFERPEIYLPASYLSYQLVKENLENVAWKAAVGVVGDHGVGECKDLMDEVEVENPEALPEKKYDYSELKESKLGIIADGIEAAKAIHGVEGIKRSYKVIKNSARPQEVFGTELLDFYNKYEKKLEKEERRFQERAEYFQKTDAYLYEIESKNSLSSNLSSLIADKKPDSLIVVYQRGSYGMKISGRSQSSRVDVSAILRDVVGDLGNAGGHPQAAGGHVERGKEEVVLERLRERLEKLS